MKQRRHGKFILLVSTLALFSSQILQAADPETILVQGTTDFLLDRANDNYIYVFERKLISNPLMQKYLPATLRVARAGDLRSLLTHRELWKDALEKDFQKDKLLGTVKGDIVALVRQLCDTAASTQKSPKAGLEKLCETARVNPISSSAKDAAREFG